MTNKFDDNMQGLLDIRRNILTNTIYNSIKRMETIVTTIWWKSRSWFRRVLGEFTWQNDGDSTGSIIEGLSLLKLLCRVMLEISSLEKKCQRSDEQKYFFFIRPVLFVRFFLVTIVRSRSTTLDSSALL